MNGDWLVYRAKIWTQERYPNNNSSKNYNNLQDLLSIIDSLYYIIICKNSILWRVHNIHDVFNKIKYSKPASAII